MMLHRVYQPSDQEPGIHPVFTPSDGLKWLRLDVGTLYANSPDLTIVHAEEETAIVILTGTVAVEAATQSWRHLGERDTVFEAPATTVYLPAGVSVRVTAESERAELAICRAPAKSGLATGAVIRPHEVEVVQRGQNLWQREVRNILTADVGPNTTSLVLGETINEPGQWSGYPPHKHDTDQAGLENVFEEVYYYRTDPEDGFGVQLHYAADEYPDQGYVVRNRDSFAIPRGYHPVVAQGGYRLYYLWFMAGPSGRRPVPFEDPRYRWVNHQSGK
ncbi:MAG: 5-deoxy-glucuronate isomerase [Sulfobacillus acidophilus]|uniref:5-deoxy-glucuronate isomerase n=1 Tax=Sulfobacillus acidophilus TaxID=53633 RepID=A0A2T2WD49_9FIRM|nr:MAG: 5-deoxy-glucuronate isomerase [Sulfobacillus acidophilus]